MPVPFRDLTESDSPGFAGFLRFKEEVSGKGMQGAFFLVSSRGDPLDFIFTRINVHNSFLWHEGDARRNAVAAIIKALFQGSNKTPDLILALAEEVPPQVFADDIRVDIPLCRISASDTPVQALSEDFESLSETINLIWVSPRPDQESDTRRLLEALSQRQILLEPFERAIVGLEEVFGENLD